MTLRTYSELSRLETFEERFRYLQLNGRVGQPTFGFERYINQTFYRSSLWKSVRNQVIARDYGNDLGVDGFPIQDRVIIHHMNPMEPKDIVHGDEDIINPEFLISTKIRTHNAIHYGDESLLLIKFAERRPGDTVPW